MNTNPAPANDPIDVVDEGLEENDDDDNPFGVYPEADIAEYVTAAAAAAAAEQADGEPHPDYVLALWEEALERESEEWFRWNQEDGWEYDDSIGDWDGRYDSEPDDDTMLTPEEYAAELHRLGY